MLFKIKFFLTYLLFFLILGCTTATDSAALFEGIADTEMETELITLVNNHRVSIGLHTLQISNEAYKHAKDHNMYMIEINALNHNNFKERAKAIALETNAILVAENVAREYSTTTQILNAWLASPGHKENIETDFDYTNICVLKNKNGECYVTQILYK